LLPDGNVLITGGVGSDGQTVAAAEIYNTETSSSETVRDSKITPRVYHTATLLTTGEVLIVGGLSAKGDPIKKAEIWDFKTNRSRKLKSSLRVARYNHSATLMANGNVLIEGGTVTSGAAATADEEFNSASQRFTPIQNQASENPDESTPRLAASLPEDGANNVAVDGLIALRFSSLLDVESVNQETVTLSGPYGGMDVKVVAAEAGRLAFVTTKGMLLPGSIYTLSINGATNIAGEQLPLTSITFTTAGQTSGSAEFDDEDWIPDSKNLKGDWRSNRTDSPWRSLPSLQAPTGVTALAGQVLKLNGKPLANVTIEINNHSARTDATGRFLLTDIPSGRSVMIINGHTANRPGKSYCMFDVAVNVKAGETAALSYTIWMPTEDVKNAVSLDRTRSKELIATTPLMPGLEIHLPRGAVLRSHHGEAMKKLSITPIALDRPPFPIPESARIAFTTQTHGAKVESSSGDGVRIIYPNLGRFEAGSRVDLWSYEAEGAGWQIYGQGTVSADGKQVTPDASVRLHTVPCMQYMGPPSDAPGEWPPPGGCAEDGDPVDLATGLFVYDQTDLVLPDVIPIVLSRTYRPKDTLSRIFGKGTTMPYQMGLVGDSANYTYIELILADGGRVRFDRINAGTERVGALFEHNSTPTEFYKAKLEWNEEYAGWDMKFKDGDLWRFKATDAVAPVPPTLQIIRDRNGNELNIQRTTSKRITKIITPNGRWVEFSYDSSDRVTQAWDNIGRAASYTYDGSGRLWKVTDTAGGLTEYTYDSSHRMLTVKDARGIVFLTNQYDSNGRVILQTQADSSTYQFAYTLDGSGKVTQTVVTDPRGNTRTVTFNSNGYTLSDTSGCCGGLAYTIERQTGTNFVTNKTDPLGRETTYDYDSLGNVTSVTELDGTSDEVTTSFTYEPTFNLLASVTYPLNRTTSYAYDSKGNLTSVTDPLSHQVTFTHNSAGQVATVKDALNNTTTYTYEAGDLVAVTNPLGHSVNRFVDSAGRVLKITNLINQTDRYEYDALNRPTKTIDPLQGMTQFSYDANGNLLSLTDARSNVTSYIYDNMDRVTTRRDPLMRDETYEYFADGLLKKVTDRKGQITQFKYDSHGRITQVTYHDGSTITYTYDNAHRVTQVVDSISGTISYTYDNLDRLVSETTAQGSVSYTYDAAGRLTSMTVAGQSSVNYAYDNADRLTSITQGSATVSFVYDNADRLTSQILANGVVCEYNYDVGSRLTDIIYKKGGVTIGDLTYEYDSADRRIKTGGSFARTALPQTITSTSYNAANHQTIFDGQTLTYDLNGNLTNDGVNTYTWNARDQLVSISGSGLTASFSYDATGRRISKTINSTTTSYLYDGANAVQEKVGSTVTANMLTGGIDQVLSRADSVGTVTPITDALGSVIALTDTSGTVQTEYTYDPFGKTAITGTVSDNPSRYTGREDDGTGLYYYRARYYSPILQRFVSEDPIEFQGGDVNLYGYVSNDPNNWTDPTGLSKGRAIAWVVRVVSRNLVKLRKVGMQGAQKARRSGGNIYACDKKTARQIEKGAFPNKKQLRHDGHNKGYYDHYQTDGKYGHTFYGKRRTGIGVGVGVAPFLGGRKLKNPYADMGDWQVGMIRKNRISTGNETLDEALDFFNPLSDVIFMDDFLRGRNR
jgi:RHS repeat-associated protein